MIEVEIKLPISDTEILMKNLLHLGFSKGKLMKESDVYFNNPVFDLKKKDMALRIRTCLNTDENTSTTTVTYKGPKLDQISMTREELEIEVSDADTCQKILEGIGFYPLFPVCKMRQYYHLENITACVDSVQNLGDFLELEIIVEDDSLKKTALKIIDGILHGLGYDRSETTRKSYLSMLQEKQ